MKKMKRALSLLLAMLMLCSTVATNVVFASAETADPAAVISVESDSGDTDDLVSADGSENTLLKAGDNSSIQEVNGDEATTDTASENNADISESEKESYEIAEYTAPVTFAVNNGTQLVVNAADLIFDFAAGSPIDLGMGIKYVVNDNNDPDNMGKLRYVYCLEYEKQFPSGATSTYSGWANEKVCFAVFHGSMYLGETCRNYVYSTGNWRYDYFVTQVAIHILNNEFTLSQAVNSINSAVGANGNVASASDKALVIDRITKLVNAANNASSAEYAKFNSDGWVDYTLEGNQPRFDVSGYEDNWTETGDGYYVSGGNFQITFTTYHGSDLRNQLSSVDVTVTDGVELRKSGNSSFSDFRLYIPEDKYNEWKGAGKEIVVTVTATFPSLWGAAMYAPSNSDYQTTGLICPYELGQELKFEKTITLHIAAENGKLKLVKSSSQPEITDGNSCYSLENAVYGVYSDSACTTEVGTLTTDANGESNELTLPIGTYYVKEKEAPKGFYLDKKVYTVKVTADYSTEPYVLEVKDRPTMDPVGILLKKVDADTMKNEGQNGLSLGGAEFAVKYYDVENCTVDPAGVGETPVRSWIFRTDEDGFSYYDNQYLVSGDDLYVAENGDYHLPLGTITIQESKSPEGFLLNDTVYVVSIKPDGTTESVTTYAVPIIPENSFKLNLKKIETGTDKAIPGAVFEHIRPNGEAETLTTDENGELSFIGMEYGEHIITEVSAPDGYAINANEIKFTVHEDNTVKVESEAVVTDTNGDITINVGDDGNINVVVEDKPAPYSLLINKKNNKDQSLSGAEFTLFSDDVCTQVVATKETDADGKILFENLIVGKKYYLQETIAPDGYVLPEEAVVYEIYVESSSPVEGVFDYYINGEKYTAADRIVNLEVINHTGMILPDTGSSMMIILTLVGVAALVVVFLLNKNNKSKE